MRVQATRSELDPEPKPWPGWTRAVLATGWPVWLAMAITVATHAWLGLGWFIVILVLGYLPFTIALWLAFSTPGDWCRDLHFAEGAPRRWAARWGLTVIHVLTVAIGLMAIVLWRVPQLQDLLMNVVNQSRP